MKIVIQTQHRENYGSHDWDGEGECPQRWKNKGGETYILEGVTVAQAMENFFGGYIDKFIETRSESWQEYIIGAELVDDCEEGPFCDEWDSPYILRYVDGDFVGTKTRMYGADERQGKPVGQVMGWKNGEQIGLSYIMPDGGTITYQEWRAMC